MSAYKLCYNQYLQWLDLAAVVPSRLTFKQSNIYTNTIFCVEFCEEVLPTNIFVWLVRQDEFTGLLRDLRKPIVLKKP